MIAALILCGAWGVAVAAQSTALPSQPGVIRIRAGDTAHATMPAGDPRATSLVFELVADESGPLTIEARSLDFNTALEVTSVDSDGSIRDVDSDDDGGI